MKSKVVTVLLVVVALLAGCSYGVLTRWGDEIEGSGDVVTRDEDISGFRQVEVSHAFKVDIRQGSSYSVVVRADDNLVDRLRVVRQGSTLKIGLKPGINFSFRNYTLEADVTMPDLTGLDLSGASRVAVSGFDSSDRLDVELSGASSLEGDLSAEKTFIETSGASRATLTGSAGDLTVRASGGSQVDLSDYAVGDANVDASGASQVTVKASGRLDADASGASQVYYLGSPTMGRIDTSGASQIRQR